MHTLPEFFKNNTPVFYNLSYSEFYRITALFLFFILPIAGYADSGNNPDSFFNKSLMHLKTNLVGGHLCCECHDARDLR